MKLNIRKSAVALSVGASLLFGAALPAHAYSYQVKPGDTMWNIAQKQHITLESILKSNPHVNPMMLRAGMTIEIPGLPDLYVVQEDDTFWSIAKQFSISVEDLMNANPKQDPYNLYDGIKLNLPQTEEQADASAMSLRSVADAPAAKSAPVAAAQNMVDTPKGEMKYERKLQVKASAYTAAASENGGWAGLDYMGNKLTLGTIAVDPKIIPLGSKVYVTGYDFNGLPVGGFIGRATDVGGAIKGNRIDIFVPVSQKQAWTFGYQNVTVYILD